MGTPVAPDGCYRRAQKIGCYRRAQIDRVQPTCPRLLWFLLCTVHDTDCIQLYSYTVYSCMLRAFLRVFYVSYVFFYSCILYTVPCIQCTVLYSVQYSPLYSLYRGCTGWAGDQHALTCPKGGHPSKSPHPLVHSTMHCALYCTGCTA